MYLIVYYKNGEERHFVSRSWSANEAISQLFEEHFNEHTALPSGLFERMVLRLEAEEAARVFEALSGSEIEKMFRLLDEVDIHGGS